MWPTVGDPRRPVSMAPPAKNQPCLAITNGSAADGLSSARASANRSMTPVAISARAAIRDRVPENATAWRSIAALLGYSVPYDYSMQLKLATVSAKVESDRRNLCWKYRSGVTG